jgi:hypothetical protein
MQPAPTNGSAISTSPDVLTPTENGANSANQKRGHGVVVLSGDIPDTVLSGDGCQFKRRRAFCGSAAFGAAAVVNADRSLHKLAEDFSGAGVLDDDVFGAVDASDVFPRIGLSDVHFASTEVR